MFSYSYQALIKAGIALIAEIGGVKVRSVPGHHAKILSKMSAILKDPDVLTIGNAMRTKSGATIIKAVKIGQWKIKQADLQKFIKSRSNT